MFEGLIRQLLEGFLGSYVKNFQPDQLKVRLLKEKLVKLEKLELVPEAFDYLQLPFALKKGHIGSLSIEFLWKRDKPIKIIIEDVTICIGERDESEWTLESIKRRDFAAKNAKLAAAELAKLSRRVSDNQAGQIFSSFISAKILDGLQVSIQNVCVEYTDGHNDLARFRFGLRLSNLELKQNSVGSYSLKILGLALYCNSLDELDDIDVDDYELCSDKRFDYGKYDYMLEPFDATVSLEVNKSGKLDEGIPQYSIGAELTGVVMLLNEIQLRHILIFMDYLGMSAIREKYAKYRPWRHPLSRKISGWERVWWRYAQDSVLLDVRRKLWKTSWSKFGERINYRRKYVELYMEKLAYLFGEKSVSEGNLQKLEQMEKESDVDDILTYRAIAERRRQESFSNTNNLTVHNHDATQEKQQPDEKTSNKQRGWLNWLSLGMLGAAGTVDCSQFSGVVPDEIVKDIFEATDFHPGASFNGGTTATKDKLYLSSIKFSIHQIVAKLRSKTCYRDIVQLICQGVITEYKVWEDAAEIISVIKSMEMVNPSTGGLMLAIRKDVFADESFLVKEAAPFVRFQVENTPINCESKVSIKFVFQPFELNYDPDVLRHALDIYHVLRSFQFQSERVLSSLNRFEDLRIRLMSKAEYIFSRRKKISVDVSFSNISIRIPWRSQDSQSLTMVLELGDLVFQSIPDGVSLCLINEDQVNYLLKNSNSTSDKIFTGLQRKDLYDYFKIKLTSGEVKIFMRHVPEAVAIVEKFGASVTIGSCLFHDESTLRNVEVHCVVDSLAAHFSVSIYDALIKLGSCFDLALTSKTQAIDSSRVFSYFLSLYLSHVFLDLHLEDKTEESLLIAFSVNKLSIRCSQEEYLECWICMKTIEINTRSSAGDCAPQVLCSCRNSCAIRPSNDVDLEIGSEACAENNSTADGCFLLHYQSLKCAYTISLSNMDIHCYPSIIGILRVFFSEIFELGGSSSSCSIDNFSGPHSEIDECGMISRSALQKYGFSNYFENGSNLANMPVDSFPFITISKWGSVPELDRSQILGPSGWRKNSAVKSRTTVRSQKCSVWKRSKKSDILLEKSVLAEVCQGPELFLMDFNVNDIKAHFHDSSCIVGSFTVPAASCLIFSKGPNCWDILASVEGLQLSSSWSTPSIRDIIWGPELSDISPILNLRIRKGKGEAVTSCLEISIAVQHVCCILSPDYLAILIGYFSLPDWKWDHDELVPDDICEDHSITPVYKFEILDSSVIIPLNGTTWYTLQLGLQQLCCGLVLKGISGDALEGIPKECAILPEHKADRIHRINVFGDGLSLSLMFLDAGGKLDQSHLLQCLPLISELNADLWIRIPIICKPYNGPNSLPSSVMMTADVCQLIAEEKYFLSGLESIIEVIDELCMADRYAKKFVSDILQFRQSKKGLKEGINENSDGTLTEIKFHANSLSVKLFRSGKGESELSRIVAEAEMKLSLAVTLDNDVPTCLDAALSGLSLYSFHNSVILVSCSSSDEISSCLDIHFSKSDRGVDELQVATQSLNCWLQFSDWNELITLIGLFTKPSERNSSNASFFESTNSVLKDGEPQCMPSSSMTREPDDSNLIVKSENISIIFRFPLWVEESHDGCGDQTSYFDRRKHSGSVGKNFKSIAFSLYSRYTEVIVCERLVKIRSNVDKIEGMLETAVFGHMSSLPFFQIIPVNMTGEVCKELPQLSSELFVGTVNLWVSHQILYFWRGVTFKSSENIVSAQVPKCVIAFKVRLKKASLLLSDGRWSCNAPLLEILVKNLVTEVSLVEENLETSIEGDLLVYYNNIHKVMWEPFVEPWSFELKLEQKSKMNALMNKSVVTDIHLRSKAQLNLNITEPLVETLFRGNEMIQDSFHQIGLHHHFEEGTISVSQAIDSLHSRRYAPYMLKNDTSVPLLFWVSSLPGCEGDIDSAAMIKGNIVQPGSTVPIYIDQSPMELLRHKPTHSTEKLNEKKLSGVPHHMISVQLDGTSGPSPPMSMDLVGLRYFEVDFSQPTDILEVGMVGDSVENERKIEGRSRVGLSVGFVAPVVFEVSVQQYSKLIRLYSTVVLLNATSMPLELRFDIPFGVSPMVLDPIYPGKEFPLPVHLAESGQMRWRPLGADYLWSEAHALSNILSQESRPGILRSFVCYPSHPSTSPFRCCISIQDMNLPTSSGLRNFSPHHVLENVTEFFHSDKMKNNYIRQVKLTSPFIVKSYLPKALSLAIESGGVTESLFLAEVDTVSLYHIDSTHDLGMVILIDGYKHTVLKFPRAEVFSTIAKSIDTKFSLMEVLTFYPEGLNGPLCITVEKIMDAVCGSRELHISVPFLLYNCSGINLVLSDYTNENMGSNFFLPSCYHALGQQKQLREKHGLSIVTCEDEILGRSPNFKGPHFTSKNLLNMSTGVSLSNRNMIYDESLAWKKHKSSSELLESMGNSKAEAHMYSPPFGCAASELMIRLSAHLPERLSLTSQSSVWSTPFFLVLPAGSTIVAVPRPSTHGAFLVSVTSRPVVGTFSARTRSVTFQPRYVISNACRREICFKQKGTEFFYRLEVGQHSHLHWADMTRELLVSVRFNEPGWEWSGSFLPNQLGDAQVKMRNYVSAALDMVRVEVQNANESSGDENIVGTSDGLSGTHLILLSDDNTGYMPYRIDNFTMEKLRIYQQKCETFETIVHSYTSSPYAWDEPCYPHRLIVEVPGERVLGSYNLDIVMECIHVHLPQTSEKPQRRLLLSIHAEGAIKVLSIVDSTYHVPRDVGVGNHRGIKDKKKLDVMEKVADFTERIILHLSFIGISVINSSPQELIFACVRDAKVEFQQSINQQKFSFQIFSLQMDNQLHDAVYPVILSFDQGNLPIQSKIRQETVIVKLENASPVTYETAEEPVICCTAAIWRKKNSSFVSFEYINLRLSPVRIELEEQVVLNLFNFARFVSSRIQSRNMKHASSDLPTIDSVVTFNDHLENQIRSQKLPSVNPIGAPCQQIFLLARKQKKIYVEVLSVAPIKLTVSFSSKPWARRDGHIEADSLILIGNTAFQRGLMALVNVEGAPIYLKQLAIGHHLASWDSIREILVRHYTRQLLHEIYKVFGSAGVIGNPMGFARNVGLGIKDFLSVPAKGVLQSPTGLITGMAQGTKSLVNNTVYAVSNAATQFSKAAHQGLVAFTFDDQAVAKQQKKLDSHSGVVNEFLEGLTGFLQSPIKGAEKHGLPGVLSGIALGTAGLVARPVASILEVAGTTAQSIRNRSGPYPNRFRIRLPRLLARELPLLPYSWEEAIGMFMLLEAEESKFKEEIFVMCKALKLPGKFIVITERMFIIFSSSSLVGFGLPEFPGIADPDWVIEVEVGLEGVIHIDREEDVVNVVVKNPETLSKHQHTRRSGMKTRSWASPWSLPISQTSIELSNPEEAEDVLQTLRKMIELGKGQHWGAHVLHRTTIR